MDRHSTVSSALPWRFLAGLLVGVLASAFIVAGASAGSGCGQQVIEDWAGDGTIDGSYSVSCYQEAIASLPEDLRSYSSAGDDISRALQQALLDAGGTSRTSGTAAESDGGAASPATDPAEGAGGSNDAGGAAATTADDPPAVENTTPGDDTATSPEATAAAAGELDEGGAGLPLPALVLIVVAGCALVAGLALAGRRIARERKSA